MAELSLPFGVYRSTRGDLDLRFRVADDADMNALIDPNDLVDVGHIIYHVADGKHYKLKTYPTFGDLTGVEWEEISSKSDVNLQGVLDNGTTWVSDDGFGTFTIDPKENGDGNISYFNTDNDWGYYVSAEEGFYFTSGDRDSRIGKSAIYPDDGILIGNGSNISKLNPASITENRILELPDASGTIALTSDISSGVTLQNVLDNGTTWVNSDGNKTFTIDPDNSEGRISYTDTDEGWGYYLNAEEGLLLDLGDGSYGHYLHNNFRWGDGTYELEVSNNTLTSSRNVNFPDADGTIALTSDVDAINTSEWVTYSGTRDGGDLIVTLGDYDNSSTGFKATISVEDGYLTLDEGSGPSVEIGIDNIRIANSPGVSTSINSSNSTKSNTISFPDASGTIALTTDLPIIPVDQGNGVGYVVSGRDETMFGNVGGGAFDFSGSNDSTGTMGATGVTSFASGYKNKAIGTVSTVFGIYNESIGYSSVTMGSRNVVGGNFGFAAGINNRSSSYYSTTLGAGLLSKTPATIVLGEANTDYDTTGMGLGSNNNPLLIVGNGSVDHTNTLYPATSRSDALIVYKSGKIIAPSLEVSLITDNKDLTTKEYVDSKAFTQLTNATFNQAISDILAQDVNGNYDLVPYGRIQNWDVSLVTDMSSAFKGKGSFNGDIGNWDVSNVSNMSSMFHDARNFNQNLSGWNVSNVTSMGRMFTNAYLWDGDISSWDVSSVRDMQYMLFQTPFTGDISNWDVSSVVNMDNMLGLAGVFNQDIGKWDVSNVTNMNSMFKQTYSFDQDLSKWCVTNITSLPTDFTTSTSILAAENFPVWSTCPLVEYQIKGEFELKTDSTTSITLSSADKGKVISADSSSAITFTIEGASLTDVGDIAYVDQMGSGEVTFVASGVTLQVNASRELKTDGQFSRVAIHKTGATTYRVFGELAQDFS